jgi:hypothetical protein
MVLKCTRTQSLQSAEREHIHSKYFQTIQHSQKEPLARVKEHILLELLMAGIQSTDDLE